MAVCRYVDLETEVTAKRYRLSKSKRSIYGSTGIYLL